MAEKKDKSTKKLRTQTQRVGRLLFGWLLITSSEEFAVVATTVRESAKASAAVAGLLFAGSLTFLGLSGVTGDLEGVWALRVSWILLMLSVFLQVAVYLVSISTSLSQARITMDKKRAEKAAEDRKERYKELGLSSMPLWGGVVVSGLDDKERRFLEVARVLVGLLVSQALCLAIGTVFMMIFIHANV